MRSRVLGVVLYALRPEARELARKNFRLWHENSALPGLDFKKLNGQKHEVWQVRGGIHFRALCVKQDDLLIWFWIGTKDECSKIV